jgi:subtilase family serine protease
MTRLLTCLAAVTILSFAASVSVRSAGIPLSPPCLNRTGAEHCLSPSEMRAAYGVDPLLKSGITGKGQTIAIIVSFGSPTIQTDLHQFDQVFSLPDPTLQVVAPLGVKHQAHTGWLGETSLDVEWAHVIAPQARILLLTSPVDETEGVQGLPEFLKLEQYARAHGADVVSQSWAATEDTLLDKKGRAIVTQFDRFYAAASRAGISFVGGSGDDGTAGLDDSLQHFFSRRVTQFPASDPHVIGVGGTQLTVGTTRTEVTWPGSGGGFSRLFAEPSYQRGLPSSVQKLLHGRRGVPDVALNASNLSAVPVMEGGNWFRAFGTSAATPQWAGVLALADAAAGRRLGDIHSTLYALAASRRYHKDLFDITSGSIKDAPAIAGRQRPLRAAPGWDPATGLGSPNAQNLITDLIKQTS